MGGPEVGDNRHRSCKDRSVGLSAGCSLEAARASAILFCASGVNGGILPSGGSTISEVRLVETTVVARSHQMVGSATSFAPSLGSCARF